MPTLPVRLELVSLEDARRAFAQEARAILGERPKKQASPAPASRQYITSGEVQELLGISKATLARWRKNGTLPYSKIGAKVFYNRIDLDKLIQESATGAADREGQR